MSKQPQQPQQQEESRLGKLYSAVVKAEETKTFILPSMMTVPDIKEYIEGMIRDRTPRHLRKEGRKSHYIDNFKIPINYFTVESNSVNYNASTGSVFLDGAGGGGPEEDDDDEDDEEDEIIINRLDSGKKQILIDKKKPLGTKSTTTIPIYFRNNDYGTMIALYIFNQGRKTIDELVTELTGIEKHLITILINKMIEDGYLKTFVDVEDDGKEIQTLELVDKDVKKEMTDENGNNVQKN
jgi:hypothetical protein